MRALLFACVLPCLAHAQECVRPGSWVVPGAGGPKPIASRELLERAAGRAVILLGELHERAEHHRWQLQTMAMLHALRGPLVLGFEMFPRRVQPVLDRWVAGELTETQFLDQSEWARVWGFRADVYLPLFHFARMYRIPMVALNVERSLIRDTGRRGIEGVPVAQREGVGFPEPPPRDYVNALFEVFLEHVEERKRATPEDPAFRRFVESQTLWDRAMAEAIRDALRRYPGRQVVGVVGRGHAVSGGVPHQLRALGVGETLSLIAWERDERCESLRPGLADAAFGVDGARIDAPSRGQARLGVSLGTAEGGAVRIDQVSDSSLAAQAGLRVGDVVLTIAGRRALAVGDIRAAVARQAPGTWLPLRVRREGTEIDIVVKFPPALP